MSSTRCRPPKAAISSSTLGRMRLSMMWPAISTSSTKTAWPVRGVFELMPLLRMRRSRKGELYSTRPHREQQSAGCAERIEPITLDKRRRPAPPVRRGRRRKTIAASRAARIEKGKRQEQCFREMAFHDDPLRPRQRQGGHRGRRAGDARQHDHEARYAQDSLDARQQGAGGICGIDGRRVCPARAVRGQGQELPGKHAARRDRARARLAHRPRAAPLGSADDRGQRRAHAIDYGARRRDPADRRRGGNRLGGRLRHGRRTGPDPRDGIAGRRGRPPIARNRRRDRHLHQSGNRRGGIAVPEMTPREIVALLDQHIIGQDDAKRAVAVAIRNRWRWQQLPAEMRKEVTPKNIIMIGPTGVGKTEITRRLAKLINAPFIKVEATKYTEVGYHGRDVESMARDLVEAGVTLVKARKRREVEEQASAKVEDRLVDLLVPAAPEWQGDDEDEAKKAERRQ